MTKKTLDVISTLDAQMKEQLDLYETLKGAEKPDRHEWLPESLRREEDILFRYNEIQWAKTEILKGYHSLILRSNSFMYFILGAVTSFVFVTIASLLMVYLNVVQLPKILFQFV